MADVLPLRALHYDPSAAGDFTDLVAPPYDVIDDAGRAELASRSPHNVVAVDLPEGDDPYAEAARVWEEWRREGIVVEDHTEALWPLMQEYDAPDGRRVLVTEADPEGATPPPGIAPPQSATILALNAQR